MIYLSENQNLGFSTCDPGCQIFRLFAKVLKTIVDPVTEKCFEKLLQGGRKSKVLIDTVSSQCIEEWKKNKRKNRNNGPDKGETLSQLRSRIVTLNVALLKRLREKNSLLNRGIPCNILLNKERYTKFCRKNNGIERERNWKKYYSTRWESLCDKE